MFLLFYQKQQATPLQYDLRIFIIIIIIIIIIVILLYHGTKKILAI